MLVLTRKVGERIQLGDDICVTLVRIDETSVRIGVEAPGDMTIVREELIEGRSERHDPLHADGR